MTGPQIDQADVTPEYGRSGLDLGGFSCAQRRDKVEHRASLEQLLSGRAAADRGQDGASELGRGPTGWRIFERPGGQASPPRWVEMSPDSVERVGLPPPGIVRHDV